MHLYELCVLTIMFGILVLKDFMENVESSMYRLNGIQIVLQTRFVTTFTFRLLIFIEIQVVISYLCHKNFSDRSKTTQWHGLD